MNRRGPTAASRSTGRRSPSATPWPASQGPPTTRRRPRPSPAAPSTCWPGTGNHASTDAPFGIQGGYIFDAVLKAGGTVRNYGFLVNNIGSIGTIAAPVSDPFTAGVVQVGPLDPSLASLTDVYFRGYDQNYPDLWRYNEWKREFDQYVGNGNLPGLSLVRFSHDHMGSFGTALGGVNTPETQQADDDLAVGRLVETVANSPYAADTLVVVTEDDCQDGPDHVDSHRATAYIVGPYVKQGAIVSTRYGQVNALRTIEDILGTQHINLNTAYQRPMADVFDAHSSGAWSYTAQASTVLSGTTVAEVGGGLGAKFAQGAIVKPKHSARYWANVTAGLDFSDADQVSAGEVQPHRVARPQGSQALSGDHGRAYRKPARGRRRQRLAASVRRSGAAKERRSSGVYQTCAARNGGRRAFTNVCTDGRCHSRSANAFRCAGSGCLVFTSRCNIIASSVSAIDHAPNSGPPSAGTMRPANPTSFSSARSAVGDSGA